MQQDTIRLQAKAKLKLLSQQQQTEFSSAMTKLVLTKASEPLIKNAKNITCYWPTKYEINTIELITHFLLQKKSCFMPVINQKNNNLDFIKYTEHTKLIPNKFGILEPEFNMQNKIDISSIDLIFTPLIAFDNNGHRIGSGAGLFDRSICTASCPIIGLAYSIQQFDNITPNDWDVKLNFVVTEKQWIEFG